MGEGWITVDARGLESDHLQFWMRVSLDFHDQGSGTTAK